MSVFLDETQTTPNSSFSGNEVRWHFDDLESDRESNIRVQIVEPLLWMDVLQAQKMVDNQPNRGDAWGALARDDKKVIGGHKGWLREDDAAKERFSLSQEA
jgi:hypothetical protein